MFLVIRWSKPWILIQARWTLLNGRGDERVAALAAPVRAVSVRRPLRDDPRTGVRERGRVVGLFVLYD